MGAVKGTADTEATSPGHVGLRHLGLYLTISLVGLVVVALVLQAGGDSEPPAAGASESAHERVAALDDRRGGEPLGRSEVLNRTLLAMVGIIAVTRCFGSLLDRARQPRVLGEVLAGIVLGPSLLGAAAPGVTGFLFPSEVVDVLEVVAQLGLLLFMFLVGMHLDLAQVRQSSRAAALISHVSIVVPFVLGAAGALAIYPTVGTGEFTGFALFMGVAVAITALPVLARILTDAGLAQTRLGALAITCAAIGDVTAWCILSVVVAVVTAGGSANVLRTLALTAAFVVLMVSVYRPLLHRLSGTDRGDGVRGSRTMVVVLVSIFLSAWTTEEIGIHAIFGAFLLGTVMPRTERLVEDLTNRLEDLTYLAFLPMFFAITGMSVRLDLMGRAELWAVAGAVLVLAVTGKWGGAMLAARACGLPWRESAAIGVLMNARGLTEIVVLTVGLELGVISPELFTIMVLVALVTTFMAPPLLRAVLPRPSPGPDGPSGQRTSSPGAAVS